MPETPVSRADLPELARKDDLNVVPTLMLLSAIDPRFPEDDSWVYRYLTRSPHNTLWIHFHVMREDESWTRSTRALIDLANDMWNGDVHTKMNDIMGYCDAGRVRRVINALIARAEGGCGPVSRKFMDALATADEVATPS